MTELGARYAVSRKTGCKWLARIAAEGAAGLHDRRHAPHRCLHAILAALAERPAPGDPDRLRGAVCQHGAARPHAAERVVARPGIRHQRILERRARAHHTLKAEACRPPQADARARQPRYDAFRAEYNAERPHSALGGATPASRNAT